MSASTYDSDYCQLHAMIPPDGISKKGYVKEVWIEYVTESFEIDNYSYNIMTPEAHNTKQRIQEFVLDSDDLIKCYSIPTKYRNSCWIRRFDKVSTQS